MNSRRGRDQQSHRDVGDLFGQDIGRVCDNNIMLRGIGGRNVIIADAETRDDFELGKQGHHSAVGDDGMISHRNALDATSDIGRQLVEIGARLGLVHDEIVRKAGLQDRPDRPIDQDVGLRSHQVSFPSALSCQRRKMRWETSASTP